MTRHVLFVSDRTGITAETLGGGLLTQFDGQEFKKTTLPFINSLEKAKSAVDFINHLGKTSGLRPLVFSTTVTDDIRDYLHNAEALFLDLFDTFIPSLEKELNTKSTHASGRAHGQTDQQKYRTRIDAMNFALETDDGASVKKFEQADIILIAPSRCGKTPTSLYMAMQNGIFATNYPLLEDDLETTKLPKVLQPHVHKLFGLTSDPDRLHQVRTERRPGSKYASMQQCSYEVRQAESMYRAAGIPFLNSANMSVEEMTTLAIQAKELSRTTF